MRKPQGMVRRGDRPQEQLTSTHKFTCILLWPSAGPASCKINLSVCLVVSKSPKQPAGMSFKNSLLYFWILFWGNQPHSSHLQAYKLSTRGSPCFLVLCEPEHRCKAKLRWIKLHTNENMFCGCISKCPYYFIHNLDKLKNCALSKRR